MPRIRRASGEDREAWNAFLSTRREASLSHRFEWRRVLRRAYRKRCHYLVAEEPEGWRGVLPLVHMKGPLAANRLVSLPFLDQGGIVAGTGEAADALRREAFRLAAELGATGLDFRGPGGRDEPPPEEQRRFRLVLELPTSEEQLWKKIGPKVRNQVRKSERAGLATERVGDGELASFYRVFAHNMKSLGAPVHSRRFFGEILAAFAADAALYLTRDAAGAPIAGAVALRHGEIATVPWAASLPSARRDCPNHSLYWRVLREARAAGAAAFDFGRDFVGTGTFHFKKQWHAEPLPLVWHSYAPDGGFIAERQVEPGRHRRLVDLWRGLPMPVANVLGPLVRRQLSN